MVPYVSHVIKGNAILTCLHKIDGWTLNEWYTAGKIQELNCVFRKSIITQLHEVLVHVHTHGYIHRDVSNNNVMVKLNGHVVLIDFCFGVSTDPQKRSLKSTSSTSVSTRRCQGTLGYSAPENGNRPAWTTESCDAYSLVCVSFDLIAGKPADESCGYHDILDEDPRNFPVDDQTFHKVAKYIVFLILISLLHVT